MRVIIVRHGEAESRSVDPARGLSTRGREQATNLGEKLATLGWVPAKLYHSPKARAQQTARIIASCLGQHPESLDGLLPESPVEPIVHRVLDSTEDLMLVSHLPFVRLLTAVLMSHRNQSLPLFDTCNAAVLKRDDAGSFQLVQLIKP